MVKPPDNRSNALIRLSLRLVHIYLICDRALHPIHVITWILLGGGGEEDTQTGLKVCRPTCGVGETEVNAVSEHESAGPGVQDVLGGCEHLPGDQLRVCGVPGGGAELGHGGGQEGGDQHWREMLSSVSWHHHIMVQVVPWDLLIHTRGVKQEVSFIKCLITSSFLSSVKMGWSSAFCQVSLFITSTSNIILFLFTGFTSRMKVLYNLIKRD